MHLELRQRGGGGGSYILIIVKIKITRTFFQFYTFVLRDMRECIYSPNVSLSKKVLKLRK